MTRLAAADLGWVMEFSEQTQAHSRTVAHSSSQDSYDVQYPEAPTIMACRVYSTDDLFIQSLFRINATNWWQQWGNFWQRIWVDTVAIANENGRFGWIRHQTLPWLQVVGHPPYYPVIAFCYSNVPEEARVASTVHLMASSFFCKMPTALPKI